MKKRILTIPGYEKVMEGIDEETNLHCIIALHSTALGPALGGVRIYPYSSYDAALEDVLRLSKAMTHKSAVAELGLGGGKSVIIADPKIEKSEELLKKFGEMVNEFHGNYIVAEDVGSSPEDMVAIHQTTPYVAALPTKKSSGDPSPFTAFGVLRGMQASLQTLFGSASFKGRTVAIQGLGHVGMILAKHLFWQGADLIVADVDETKTEIAKKAFAAIDLPTQKISEALCDIFAPCALGGILTKQSVERLKCKCVAGAANNQLENEAVGEMLHKKGILYAPDFVINAGGLINAVSEFEKGGYNPIHSRNKVDRIYDILLLIYAIAKRENQSTERVAQTLAENNLKNEIKKRQDPINFSRA